VGALSVDRPFAVDSMLDKDLRILLIVASIISQVLKINRMIHVEKDEILVRDERVLEELRSRYRLENLIGQSKSIEKVLSIAATAARSRATILITGDTGTGKELVANVVHYNSDRASGPLIKVNCGALPETLLESELFGHVKGAFTGAIETRKGRFEMADGGTLFLDEVAEMTPRLQVKLLRVLQEKEFEPVGGAQTIQVDVRVVAATSKNLKIEIEKDLFRKDLYYRLNVIPIHLPPLSERRDDIPLLVHYFMDKYNNLNGKNVSKISQKVLDLLIEYPWPGNVRELENCIERGIVMSPGNILSLDFLPEEIVSHKDIRNKRAKEATLKETDIRDAAIHFCKAIPDPYQARETIHNTIEETIIRMALKQKISKQKIAEQLNMSRMTLRKKMREYGIE
jgi:Nif-specific regulatory protein